MIETGTDPRDVAAYLGEANLAQGRFAEAREWLGKQDFSPRTRAHGNHMLGRLEMESGNLPAAGQAFDRALAAGGEAPELWVDIGRLRYRGGEQAQAIQAAERAVELGPENPLALRFRAQLVRDVDGSLAALPWFERALDVAPNDPALLGDYAATLGELGRARDMLAAVRHLSTVDPANRRAYYLQAVLAARAGNYDLALTLLQRSGQVESEVPGAMLLLALIDMERGNYSSAAQMLDRLATLQPDNRRVVPLLARALVLGRNDKELAYRFQADAARASASPYLQTLMARSLEALGDRERAGPLLDLAARQNRPEFSVIRSATTLETARMRADEGGTGVPALTRAALTAGRSEAATEAARSFARRFPGSGDALVLVGDTETSAKRLAAAEKAYLQALQIRRPWPLTFKLASVLSGQGKQRDAVVLLAGFAQGEPGNVEAMTLLAMHHARMGDWRAAAEYCDLVIAFGAARDPQVLAVRAKAALESGETDLAVRLAEIAHDLQPMHPASASILAQAYRAAGYDDDLVALAEAKVRILEQN
ncbi:tetratricopeptide repeat protein [Qipengyuania sp. RS5-5]|uniref:Tetratricopeptide repeat protein n=1 Tax=Parerythrobacter lacustris TaxID=2969984 RepID=A0ABT1XS12_9SPHN|nr:tetratricopeptide repeat protein [Parerythrobacter lacustris]MCR2834007.1 tetratricopeptide repeat protein [Parerythrobacter lacustris]